MFLINIEEHEHFFLIKKLNKKYQINNGLYLQGHSTKNRHNVDLAKSDFYILLNVI